MGASICLRLKASNWRVSEVARSVALAISCAGPAQAGIGTEALEQELGVAGDDHQEVVEVVRDAAGEAADGFHFLRLAELLLQRARFGDVFHENFEGVSVFAVGNGSGRKCGRRSRRRLCGCIRWSGSLNSFPACK